MSRVVVVGSVNIDQRIDVDALPVAGETVLARGVVFTPGGKGGNQAVAAAHAGATTALVAAVGDDAHAAQVMAALADAGVDCSAVRVVPGAPTGLAVIPVDAHGENSIIVVAGANSRLSERDVEDAMVGVGPGDVLVLQLEIPLGVVRHAARLARERGALVVLNAAPAPATLDGLLDDVDVLVVNEHEIAVIGRLRGLPDAGHTGLVRSLATLPGPVVVCTAGAAGACAHVDGRIVTVAPPPVVAVDTTAAGDTFTGYLAAALARDPRDLVRAMTVATHAATAAVTRPGAMASIPRIGDVTTIEEARR